MPLEAPQPMKTSSLYGHGELLALKTTAVLP